jgi:hypothetical protein
LFVPKQLKFCKLFCSACYQKLSRLLRLWK